MFDLTPREQELLGQWVDIQDNIALEQQRKSMPPEQFNHLTMDGKYPYGGAVGGMLTYSFTPTSLGTVVRVTHGLTQQTIDLTDYSEW